MTWVSLTLFPMVHTWGVLLSPLFPPLTSYPLLIGWIICQQQIFRVPLIHNLLMPCNNLCLIPQPREFGRGPSWPASGGDGIMLVAFVTFIYVIPAAPWHPEMQWVNRAIAVNRDVWVSVADPTVLERPLGDQIVKKNSIVSMPFFHADDYGRHWVLRLLYLTLDSTSAKCKSVRKPRAYLPDSPLALTSAYKYFQMLPGPPGALQCALRLCKRILRCSWKHLRLWRCIQDATRFDC